MADRDADSFVLDWPDGGDSGSPGQGERPDAEWSDPDFDVWNRGRGPSSRSGSSTRRRRDRPLVASTRMADERDPVEADEEEEEIDIEPATGEPQVEDTAVTGPGHPDSLGVRLRLLADPARPRS